MKDQKTVSNEFHELEYIAKKFGVDASDVSKAKEFTGSNNRDVIEAHLKNLKPVKKFLAIQEAANINKQHGNFDFNPYALGLANGLILALAILQEEEPNYLKAPVDGFLEDKKGEAKS